MPKSKSEPSADAKAESLQRWPTIADVAQAAAALAAHIREHLPMKDEPPPPSGGPDGGPGDCSLTLLMAKWSHLRLALFAMQEQHPDRPPVQILVGEKAIVREGAIRKIRRGYDEVARCYGFDRLDAGTSVEERIPELDPVAVRWLEWGASTLLEAEPTGARATTQTEAEEWTSHYHDVSVNEKTRYCLKTALPLLRGFGQDIVGVRFSPCHGGQIDDSTSTYG